MTDYPVKQSGPTIATKTSPEQKELPENSWTAALLSCKRSEQDEQSEFEQKQRHSSDLFPSSICVIIDTGTVIASTLKRVRTVSGTKEGILRCRNENKAWPMTSDFCSPKLDDCCTWLEVSYVVLHVTPRCCCKDDASYYRKNGVHKKNVCSLSVRYVVSLCKHDDARRSWRMRGITIT